jgi:hypothetical protein
MSRRTNVFLAAACIGMAGAAAVTASQPSAAEPPAIGRSELRGLFPGTFAIAYRGLPASVTALPGGELLANAVGMRDTGRWRISGSRLCILLEDWFDGKTRCTEVLRDGDWYRAADVSFRKH